MMLNIKLGRTSQVVRQGHNASAAQHPKAVLENSMRLPRMLPTYRK